MDKLSPNQLKAIKSHNRYLIGRGRMYCENARTKSGQMPHMAWFEVKIKETGDDRLYIVNHMKFICQFETYFELEKRGQSIYARRISKWNAKTGDYDE